MVRGRGYARSLQDFENIVLTATDNGTPVRIGDVVGFHWDRTSAGAWPIWTAGEKPSPVS